MPQADIIIGNWNAGEQLRECLASIAETVPRQLLGRVAVVDNAVIAGLLNRRLQETKRGRRSIVSSIFLCGMFAMLLHLMVEDAQYTQPYAIYYWTFMALASHHAVWPTYYNAGVQKC